MSTLIHWPSLRRGPDSGVDVILIDRSELLPDRVGAAIARGGWSCRVSGLVGKAKWVYGGERPCRP